MYSSAQFDSPLSANTMFSRLIAVIAVLVSGSLACPFAYSFPSKPVRLIIPAPPGGTTDVMARVVQEPLAKLLGQPLVIDYKPGAGQMIGTRYVADSPADGHTLLFANPALTITPVIKRDAGWDPLKSFAAVSVVGISPMVLLVNGALPVNDLKGFIAYAKRRPLEYGSTGFGTVGHIYAEVFLRDAGLKMLHVPFSGGAPAITALVSGHVKMQITSIHDSIASLMRAGKLKAIGVGSDSMSSLVPGVPPIADVVPGFRAEVWFGVLAPAATPANAIEVLHRALAQALREPHVSERFSTFGSIAKPSESPGDFTAALAAEHAQWRSVVHHLGIKPE